MFARSRKDCYIAQTAVLVIKIVAVLHNGDCLIAAEPQPNCSSKDGVERSRRSPNLTEIVCWNFVAQVIQQTN